MLINACKVPIYQSEPRTPLDQLLFELVQCTFQMLNTQLGHHENKSMKFCDLVSYVLENSQSVNFFKFMKDSFTCHLKLKCTKITYSPPRFRLTSPKYCLQRDDPYFADPVVETI